jgi:uncharacterized protein (DUF433 family)
MTVRWQDCIEERKDVMLGKPVFKGTRLTVEHVLRELGTGITHDDLLRNYPRLKAEHLLAAMQYAADVLAREESTPQEMQAAEEAPGIEKLRALLTAHGVYPGDEIVRQEIAAMGQQEEGP